MSEGDGKHLGFTGTQIGVMGAQHAALCVLLSALKSDGFDWMHNGDCIGSDWQAGSTWISLGGKIWGHPPTISAKRAYLPFDKEDPPLPYWERNQGIIVRSELLVATPARMEEELRSGTWMTIRLARRAGIPKVIIWPNGHTERTIL